MATKALITNHRMVGSHLADFLLEETNWDVYGVCEDGESATIDHLLDRSKARRIEVFFKYADLNTTRCHYIVSLQK